MLFWNQFKSFVVVVFSSILLLLLCFWYLVMLIFLCYTLLLFSEFNFVNISQIQICCSWITEKSIFHLNHFPFCCLSFWINFFFFSFFFVIVVYPNKKTYFCFVFNGISYEQYHNQLNEFYGKSHLPFATLSYIPTYLKIRREKKK